MALTPNKEQQKAINILNGSVMLLAGPGTGKTFTVIQRIEHMLKNGIKPSSILCLTFSDAAANEMRQRLIKKMGVVASSVDVYTYHSFCNDIIKTFPSQFEMVAGVRLIKDTEKIKLMRDCIDELELKYFIPTRGDKYFFTKKFIEHIEKLKSKRLNKKEYLDFIETNPTMLPRITELKLEIAEREARKEMRNKGRYDEIAKIENNIEKAKELWDVYELYVSKMLNNNLIDFSDMINFVLDEFEKDKEFLKEVSNKYEYFLIDEYQDTNNLQNSIIFNLVDGNNEKNIFVVGDDDQIIYGFQGARIDSIENFLIKYPKTNVICLKESNRSTQSILDFSHAVISQDENRLENNENFKNKDISKRLTAVNQNIIPFDRKVRRLHFGNSLQEINHIIDEIVELVNSDNCPKNDVGEKDLSKIAIISRKRTELQTYAEMLKGKNISCQIDEGKSIFAIRSSILVYFYMKALDNYLMASDKLFGLLLSDPFKLDLEDYNKILHEQQLLLNKKPNDFISLMRKLDGWKNPEKIEEFLKTFDYLTEYSQSNDLRSTVIEIINRTGILEAFYKEEKNRMENLTGIKKIINEATEYGNLDTTKNLGDFVKYLSDCWTDEIDITTEKNSIVQNAIQLTTYHGSKGREFDYVYLPNLIAKNWEDFKMPGEYRLICDEVLTKEDDEKRKDSELLKLLFVGITRAKYGLVISFADMEENKSNQITKYLAQLADYDFDNEIYEYKEDDFTREFFRSLSRDVFDNQKMFSKEIKERVAQIVLSPSRLNDYLACPRKFFYTKVLGINVEDADWDGANFGTTIHKILENAVKIAKDKGNYPSKVEITEQFYNIFNSQKFTTLQSKEKFEKQGINIIENYYPHFAEFSPDNIIDIEFSFEGVQIGEDFVKGKIDRIEKNSDETYSLYDYKTGNYANENQITIGGKKENYYNQLCFYKYAFEKITGNKVSKVGIIYVENHKRSVYMKFCNEDMEYIETKIKETYKNIRDMKFNPIKETEDGTCKFCAYKHLCSLDVI